MADDTGRPTKATDQFSCGCEGRSGVRLSSLTNALTDLRIAKDAEVRQYLPRAEPSMKNTCDSLKVVVMPVWYEDFKTRATITLTSSPSKRRDEYHATAHVSGVDEKGTTLSSDRYSIVIRFDEQGRVVHQHTTVTAIDGGSTEGATSLYRAIDIAESSLNSKAWQNSWNSMHRDMGSVYLTRMNYYVHRESSAPIVDQWIKIAQTVGIRAIRYDQPQWALTETLTDLLKQKLEEAEAMIDAPDARRVSTSSASARVQAVTQLGETIQSLRGLLGSVGERLAESVETLRSKWADVQEDAKARKRRKLEHKLAITPAGRAILDAGADVTYVVISAKGRKAVPQLQQALPNIPEGADRDGAQMLIEMSERPIAFDVALMPILAPLIHQGWAESVTCDAPLFIEALAPLSSAPQLADDVDLSSIPSHYRKTLTRSFKE